jgi:hypothetical protein
MNGAEKGLYHPENAEQFTFATAKREHPSLDPEIRRAVRDQVGTEIIQQYLEVSPEDDEQTRELKERVAEMDFYDTLGELLETKKPGDIKDALETMGISHSAYKTKTGRKVEQWRLRLPGRNAPGCFTVEKHLKAFLVGFASTEDISEKIKVIERIFEYLDYEVPKEVTLPESELPEIIPLTQPEPELDVPQSPETIPSAPAEPIDPEIMQPDGLPENLRPDWRQAFTRRFGRNLLPFIVGLATLLPGKFEQPRPTSSTEGDRIEAVDRPSAASTRSEMTRQERSSTNQRNGEQQETEEEFGNYILRPGETIAGVVQRLLGGRNREAIIKVLKDNGVSDPVYGVTDGKYDAYRLPSGFEFSLRALRDFKKE